MYFHCILWACKEQIDIDFVIGAVVGMLGARLKSWMEAQLGRAKKRKQKQSRPATATATTGPLPPPHLSSPESAYSTGYSTDGTSPGTAPAPLAAPLVAPPPPPAPPTTHLYHEPAKVYLCLAIKYFLIAAQICAYPWNESLNSMVNSVGDTRV